MNTFKGLLFIRVFWHQFFLVPLLFPLWRFCSHRRQNWIVIYKGCMLPMTNNNAFTLGQQPLEPLQTRQYFKVTFSSASGYSIQPCWKLDFHQTKETERKKKHGGGENASHCWRFSWVPKLASSGACELARFPRPVRWQLVGHTSKVVEVSCHNSQGPLWSRKLFMKANILNKRLSFELRGREKRDPGKEGLHLRIPVCHVRSSASPHPWPYSSSWIAQWYVLRHKNVTYESAWPTPHLMEVYIFCVHG
jgi:hypothetical protein